MEAEAEAMPSKMVEAEAKAEAMLLEIVVAEAEAEAVNFQICQLEAEAVQKSTASASLVSTNTNLRYSICLYFFHLFLFFFVLFLLLLFLHRNDFTFPFVGVDGVVRNDRLDGSGDGGRVGVAAVFVRRCRVVDDDRVWSQEYLTGSASDGVLHDGRWKHGHGLWGEGEKEGEDEGQSIVEKLIL